jgi:hypothetical protein
MPSVAAVPHPTNANPTGRSRSLGKIIPRRTPPPPQRSASICVEQFENRGYAKEGHR